MSLKLTLDIGELSSEQREMIAGFIIAYPTEQPSPEKVFTLGKGGVIPNDPPVIAPVPTATEVIPSPPPGVTVTVSSIDKDGYPWDERIHSSSKAQTQEGLWRLKRGVEGPFIEQVRAELRRLMSIPSPLPVPRPIPTGPVADVIPSPPAAPGPVLVPAAPSLTGDGQGYLGLVRKVTELIETKKMDHAELNAILASLGVPSLALLGNRLDLIPNIVSLVDSLVHGR